MDLVTSSYLPGDPRLIDQIVYELKSQGIFDQFRKECIADVDTKPAYQNLSQRVEGSVMNFLRKQKFSESMNKNQLREQLRKNISESGFLETGVERIVDQVVNPKINTVFLPKVEDVVYRYLGIEKPNQEIKQEIKVDVVDLLPNDLEAISPESVHDHSFNSNSDKKDESIEINENSLNSSNTKTEDESPPFELLEENTKFSMHEENSVDSHLSGISGLASHESGHSTEMKDDNEMDISQDVSQASLNSEGNLSIVTSEEDTKMEICEDSNLSEHKEIKKETSGDNDNEEPLENKTKEEKHINSVETDVKGKPLDMEEKIEENKTMNEIKTEDKKEGDSKKSEDKKTNENKSEPKKIHDKHKSSRSDKEKKDSKDKKSKSKSDNKSKDHKDSKSHSKHSSSTKDKDPEKEKKDYRNGKDKKEDSEKDKQVRKEDKERDKSKDKSSKSKEKSEKDRERSEKDRDKVAKDKDKSDKERTHKDKSDKDRSDKNKEKSDKEKNRSEKSKSEREKDKVDKDKLEKEKSSSSKHKEKPSSSSKKDGSNKEKDKGEDKSSGDKSSSSKDRTSSSSSKHKESSHKDKDNSKISKDKDRSKSGSSNSKNKDNEKRGSSGDSKSRSSDKQKKSDKDRISSSHHDKSNSSFKKDKDKKAVDDHYSIKDKKSERRSTDRDSNDGSSKMSRNGSFTESYSQSLKGSSKESSEVFSSGSGDSSNSDKMEDSSVETSKNLDNMDTVNAEALQTIKYNKPKFASNIHEAMKIMKIRKQLAKLERQNQLSLTRVQVKDSPREPNVEQHMKGLSVVLEKTLLIPNPANNKVDDLKNKEKNKSPVEYKSDKEELKELSDKQQIRNEESESPPVIMCNKYAETMKEAKELIIGKSPMLKSQDLSMESFEALEARLAQEMSNMNYQNMYGEEDDNYECVSVSFSPVKISKGPDELKPCLKKKKFLFDTSNANNDGDKEFELVVSKQLKESTEEICNNMENDGNVPIIISDSPEHRSDVSQQGKVDSEDTHLFIGDNNIVVENGDELVIDEVREEFIDYIQETTIDDMFNNENSVIVENEKEMAEENAESIQETVLEIHEKCDLVENVKEECNYEKEFENRDVGIKVYEYNDEFKGFDDVDRDDANVIKFAEKVSEIGRILDELANGVKEHIVKNSTPILPTKLETDKIESLEKEDRIIFKHGLSLESSMKEVTNMSSAIQDLLQKNGKKLFIKVDKLEHKLPSKVLVSFQGMETDEIMNNSVCQVDNIGADEEAKNIQDKCTEERTKQAGLCNGDEPNKNVEIFKEPSNAIQNIIFSPRSNENWCVDCDKWADEDSPCYYFDQTNSHTEFHLKILNDMIGKLEKAVEKQSLQIHNNIPSVKKRGRKRKAQSTENNNSIGAHCKPEPKRKHVTFATTNQNGGNLCNTNVSQNQSFSLPLSPADSEKSDEHKKEEPVTVKTKRTGRVSNTKRYSSEDLYKPRPVLSSSTRRRSAKLEHKP